MVASGEPCLVELFDQGHIIVFINDLHNKLQWCLQQRDLASGRNAYSQILGLGLDCITILCDHVIQMFALCGSMVEANQTFSRTTNATVYTWNSIISAHSMVSDWSKACQLYESMWTNDVEPDRVTYLYILKGCAYMHSVRRGMCVYSQIIQTNFHENVTIGNTLMYMFMKCESLEDARRVFDKLSYRDGVSWNVMISAYAELGGECVAFELFQEMQSRGMQPDRVTYLSILKACIQSNSLEQGQTTHDHIIKNGLDSDVVLANTLMNMYAECERFDEADEIFGSLPNQSVVSWGVLITRYSRRGDSQNAFRLFQKMLDTGISPTRAIFFCSLKACGDSNSLLEGKLIHDQIIRSVFDGDALLHTTLVDMYAKCGSLEEAGKIFARLDDRDDFAWGTIISGHAQHGYGHLALQLFDEMLHASIKPNATLYLYCLRACGSILARREGRLIQDAILKGGLDFDVILGNALVDMYVKFEDVEEATRVFNHLPHRDVTTWSTIIAGHVDYGDSFSALEHFDKMLRDGIIPDRVVLLSVLKACGTMGGLEHCRLLHDFVVNLNFDVALYMGNSLIDMYARCGSMDDAKSVCDRLTCQDGLSWAAMVAGYAQCGYFNSVRECFETMQQRGFKATNAICLNILVACSHAGSLEEGCWFFEQMRNNKYMLPEVGHYSCMVDLLGRAGYLLEAEDFFKVMPATPNSISWTSLLTSCKTFVNNNLVSHTFEYMPS